jgi:hypothetical protein
VHHRCLSDTRHRRLATDKACPQCKLLSVHANRHTEVNYFYVICPVGADDNFQQKKLVLEALGARHKIAPFFPLEQHTYFSVPVVKEDIRRAHFVLADLTKERPSCYFELGLAEALSLESGSSGVRVGRVEVQAAAME